MFMPGHSRTSMAIIGLGLPFDGSVGAGDALVQRLHEP